MCGPLTDLIALVSGLPNRCRMFIPGHIVLVMIRLDIGLGLGKHQAQQNHLAEMAE